MTLPSYRTCVFGGVIAGVAVATCLAPNRVTFVLVASAAIVAALLIAAATKAVSGRESFTFFHYAIASLVVAAIVLRIADEPLLRGLDLIALALAVTQAIGRIGCLSSGCCHGRPFRWGLRYGATHVATGFSEHWAGARLLPVQAMESSALFVIAGGGAAAIVRGAAPGAALSAILTASAAVRFTLELLRGDARPQRLAVSEAQWTSLGIALMLMVLRAVGLVPASPLADVVTIGLLLGTAALALRGDRVTAGLQLDELARALREARQADGQSQQTVVTTTHGLRISCGHTGGAEHYSLSSNPVLPERAARWLAAIVRDTAHPDARAALVPGRDGVWHVVIEADRDRAETVWRNGGACRGPHP